MQTSVFKLTRRSIRTFFGRYMALLLIVALSAGFFAGLKITKDAMVNTGDEFLAAQNMYDFRLLSTLGFTADDAASIAALDGIEAAEGGYTLDAMMTHAGSSRAYKLLSIPEQVNLPALTAGRMPTAADECLADRERFTEADLGTVIRPADDNDTAAADSLGSKEYTIVGLVESPLYIGIDRGTTGIGSGALYAFLYLPAETFTSEVFTEINLTLTQTAPIYSDAYDALIDAHEDAVADRCTALANARYANLLAASGLPAELAAQAGLTEPETYVLTRDENVGYVSFENDTAIISGIANIFPVFFILIAMLVCITTMTRMVDEERTQIGVLKAMGFGNGAIIAKYLLYAGSATLIGWAVGFFLCTWGLPKIFWFAYNALYDFAPLPYLFSPALATLTLVVSLAGILGSTYISCRRELFSLPAKLIRPRAAKNGKRILLERITPLWNRLPFLQKITLRNMFRYKQRLIMMLVGISCCAGLVVTAFGVRDSMIDIGTLQFDEIQRYDMEAAFAEGKEEAVTARLAETVEIDAYLTAAVDRVDLHAEESMHSVTLMSFTDTARLRAFWDLRADGKALALPEAGEALISTKIAEKLALTVGDSFEIEDADRQRITVTVSGIFDNYVYNYVILPRETYAEAFGEWAANTVLLSVEGDTEAIATSLTEMEEITSVSQLSHSRETVDSALSCLDYIIWLIVLFSGALAFIVIFNLTNINLAERSREIATVQVLGFYPKETESYVLRENLILSVAAALIGLPLGTLFHRVVMHMIVIDSFTFDIRITPLSYLLAFLCTLLFTVIVNGVMKRQISKIRMAESLKAVE